FRRRRRHTRFSRDWSSDVCSSDLVLRAADQAGGEAGATEPAAAGGGIARRLGLAPGGISLGRPGEQLRAIGAAGGLGVLAQPFEIGRASCRERAEAWAGARARDVQ